MIRVAEPSDLDTVAALLCAFRDWWGSSSPSDETFRETAEQLLRNQNTEFLLAGTSGLAQLRFRLSAWTGVQDCWLEDLYVSDDARGTGLGKALLEACFERARARGCRRIELDVNESNAHAIRFYTSLGFATEPKPRAARSSWARSSSGDGDGHVADGALKPRAVAVRGSGS